MRWPSAVAVLVGSFVLLGWALDNALLRAWLPGLTMMKANTAAAFIIAGLSLSFGRDGGASGIRRSASLLLAAVVMLTGLLTGAEFVAPVPYNIDQILFSDPTTSPGDVPGRMAKTTAAAFTLLGAALLLGHARRSSTVIVTQVLASTVGLVAVPALLAYGFDAHGLRREYMNYTPMALPTAFLFVSLGFETFTRERDSAVTRLLRGHSKAGLFSRRLLAAGTIIPFVSGFAALRAMEADVIGATLALTLVATANIGVLTAIILRDGIALERAEMDSRRVEAIRGQLAAIVESSGDAVIGKTVAGVITSWNAGATRIYGFTPQEAIGQSIGITTDPSRAAEPFDLMDRVKSGATVYEHETVRWRKDGTPVDVSLAMSPILDERGLLVGVSTISRDITERKRLERKAKEAELRLKALVETSPVGIYLVENGRFSYVNPVMSEIFGYTSEELIGAPAAELLTDPSDLVKVQEEMRNRLERGARVKYEAFGLTKDGTRKYIEVHGGVVDNGTRRLVGMMVDVTERKRMQDALAKNESLLREAEAVAHVGSWDIDLATKSVDWSDETFRILGMDRRADHASYDAFVQRIHPDDRAAVEKMYWESLTTREPYDIDFRVVLPDGSVKSVHAQCATYYDDTGQPIRSVGTAQDVTDRKRAEDALSRLNDELEARVEARTAELQVANKELEAFSYSVSHDLRAPLRALQGFSHILLEDHQQELSEQARRYLGLIGDNALHMGALVDDLLAFSRLGRQPVHWEPVNLCALVRQVFEQLEPERNGRQVTLRITSMPPCFGDPSLLRQVVVNLMSNALKFTRNREQPKIKVGMAAHLAEPGERVYFVKDNGVGFDMQYAGKLFGIFQRLHRAAEYEGTGVGLAIVQRIVHRHGGRVWVDASPDQGATFYIGLPEERPHGA